MTEWTHLLPDGTVGTVSNRRFIARDSAGQVYEEHRNFASDSDSSLGESSPVRTLDLDCSKGLIDLISTYFGFMIGAPLRSVTHSS
jgi:hypothetical protein